jgi:hypothetical protein
MFLATSNKVKGLMHMSYIGHVTAGELRRNHNDVVALLAEMPVGFKMLVDLGRLEFMDTDCMEELGKIMELFDEHGMRLVVRVIPDLTKDIGFKILEVFHYPHRPRTINCKTMVEAEKLLSL